MKMWKKWKAKQNLLDCNIMALKKRLSTSKKCSI